MYVTLLSVLVAVETLLILLIAVILLSRKNNSLNKYIEQLLLQLREGIFSRLVNE